MRDKKVRIVLGLVTLLVLSSCVKRVPREPLPDREDALTELLRVTGIHEATSMKDVVRETQRLWLRTSGTERWQMADQFAKDKDKIEPLLGRLGLIEAIEAKQTHYDYAVVLGSLGPAMQNRINHLIRQWKRGVRVKKLVFLGGQRNLDPAEEPYPRLKTETDLMKLHYRKSQWPKAMRKIPVEFIDAPAKKDAQGQLKRPNTGDTIVAWLKANPSAGSVLALSSQPFVQYQDAVLKTELPPRFIVETIGPRAQEGLSMAIHLDNLARLLYQEQRLISAREQ